MDFMRKILTAFFLLQFILLFSEETKLNLIDNSLKLKINGEYIDFFLSSNFNDYLSLDNETIENLKLKENEIKQLKIGNIILNNVKFQIGEKKSVGFGILKDYNIKIDYKNNQLSLNIDNFNNGIYYTKKNGLLSFKGIIKNFNINDSFSFDTNEEYNYLNESFFKKTNLDKKIFQSVELFEEDSILPKKNFVGTPCRIPR